ncbi:hypothetical protein ABZS96_38025 [Streptomyces avermitilis]|uniref:COG4315 family predicted lipoprotein n=1 Tax=Streptomyces avermitilis TaxID=33903 RepID=UPI0033AC3733
MRISHRMLAATTLSTVLLTLAACGGGATEEKDEGGAAGKDAPAASVKLSDSEYGRVLVDQAGRTLYAFTKDKAGVSNCGADCIAVWPALTTRSDPKPGEGMEKSLLTKTELIKSVTQVTYNKWPLYYYVGDAVAGDINGQGVDDEWFVVTADGKLVTKQAG